MYYPSIRFFSSDSADNELGAKVDQGDVKYLREALANALGDKSGAELYTGNTTMGIWEGVSQDVTHELVVVQEQRSSIAAELALDLSSEETLRVRIVSPSNEQMMGLLGHHPAPQLFVLDRSLVFQRLEGLKTREGVYTAVQTWFLSQGFFLPDLTHRNETEDVNSNISEMAALMRLEGRIKTKLHLEQLSDVVFQLDIERALKHSLLHEIPSKKIISGDVMKALQNYLTVLSMYFPLGKNGMQYLKEIKEVVENKSEISGKDFESLVKHTEEKNEPVYLSPSGWIGCRGSKPNLRGFPCGLWLTFHTLTVHSLPSPSPPTIVLEAILGYVKYFFGCTDCSQHFQDMATTIKSKVKTGEDSVLWLWEAHNAANARLKGDLQTEDPRHPKVQFPEKSSCSSCHLSVDGFDRLAVFSFLSAMYQNISYLHLDELPTPAMDPPSNLLRHEVLTEEKYLFSDTSKPSAFNLFDVSLCVVLYICCIGIVLLVSVKFFIKKNYRRKAYIYDIFQKV